MIMADWKYGDAGDRIPVKVGDVWKVGDNYFACGDLEEDAGQKLLDFCQIAPDIFYSDPPWDKGNAKSFRTKAGVGRDVDFSKLLRIVAELSRSTKTFAFIEMGFKENENLKMAVRSYNGVFLKEYNVTHFRKHPSKLNVFHHRFDFLFPLPDFTGIDDSKTPFIAMKSMQSAWAGQGRTGPFYAFDCCMGRGIVAEAALSVGANVIGSELNPRRLAVTIDKVAKKLKAEPVHIGVL